jgi:hypothetical protein
MNETTRKALRLSRVGLIASALLFVACVAPAGAGQTNVKVPTATTPARPVDQWGHIGHETPARPVDQWGHIGHETPTPVARPVDQWGHIGHETPVPTARPVDQWGHIGHETPVTTMDQWGHISTR